MTNMQIKQKIIFGIPFFASTEQGDVLARYILWGPVFIWRKNQMLPAPLQGSDLLWWLQVSEEEKG